MVSWYFLQLQLSVWLLLEPSSRLDRYVEVLHQCGSRLMPLPLLAALQVLLSVSALAMRLA